MVNPMFHSHLPTAPIVPASTAPPRHSSDASVLASEKTRVSEARPKAHRPPAGPWPRRESVELQKIMCNNDKGNDIQNSKGNNVQ